MRILTALATALLFLCYQSYCQDLKIPQPSTLQKIEQDFGLGKITISYSRPNAKGRKIFGQTEPFGIVWRTGANAATMISFTDTVMMEKHKVPPGEYSLFTIPGNTQWTVILNHTANQWGAYSYDSTKDLLRFTVKPMHDERPVETFTIDFANMGVDQGDLQLRWEDTQVSIHLEIDVDAMVMANIDQLMKGEKKPYYFASIYYYNHNKDMNKAMSWIEEADKSSPNAFNIKYWKARIQLKMGDKAGSIASASEGLKLATNESSAEYIRLNNEVLAEAKK